MMEIKTLSRKETISKILALIFILSGMTDLGHGLLADPLPLKSMSHKREFRAQLSSNTIPDENRFNRGKSEDEFKEESDQDESKFFISPPSNFNSVRFKSIRYKHIFLVNSRPPQSPLYLINRQIVI